MEENELIEQAYLEALSIAKMVHGQYPMVPRDDINQELCVWILKKKPKVLDWMGQGKGGVRALRKSLYYHGRTMALAEKVTQLGCTVDDLYFYSTTQLYEMLPDVLKWENWPEGPPPDNGTKPRRRRQALSEGANRTAMLADISRAINRLELEDRVLLFSRFGTSISLKGLAEVYDLSIAGMKSKIDRAVRRLQRVLGGDRPDFTEYTGTRRVMSNAEARSVTGTNENRRSGRSRDR